MNFHRSRTKPNVTNRVFIDNHELTQECISLLYRVCPKKERHFKHTYKI